MSVEFFDPLDDEERKIKYEVKQGLRCYRNCLLISCGSTAFFLDSSDGKNRVKKRVRNLLQCRKPVGRLNSRIVVVPFSFPSSCFRCGLGECFAPSGHELGFPSVAPCWNHLLRAQTQTTSGFGCVLGVFGVASFSGVHRSPQWLCDGILFSSPIPCGIGGCVQG